jgi:predicted nucleic acid-binding Zn ribbon protein
MQRAGRIIGKMQISGGVNDPEIRARAAWSSAAGKKIAEHTRATALVRETLIVEVEDMVWQRQLNTLRHFLLKNLSRILGEGVVKEIDFRPMPARRGPQSAPVARPADEGIEDPVLALLYQQSRRKAI